MNKREAFARLICGDIAGRGCIRRMTGQGACVNDDQSNGPCQATEMQLALSGVLSLVDRILDALTEGTLTPAGMAQIRRRLHKSGLFGHGPGVLRCVPAAHKVWLEIDGVAYPLGADDWDFLTYAAPSMEALLDYIDALEAERAKYQGQSIPPPADEICTVPPPRCPARRSPTAWELIKFATFGSVRGFDLVNEPRCRYYAGHEQFEDQEEHEDLTGRRWAE